MFELASGGHRRLKLRIGGGQIGGAFAHAHLEFFMRPPQRIFSLLGREALNLMEGSQDSTAGIFGDWVNLETVIWIRVGCGRNRIKLDLRLRCRRMFKPNAPSSCDSFCASFAFIIMDFLQYGLLR